EGQGPVPQVQGRVHGRGDRAERGVGHRERGPHVIGTGHVALDVAGASAGRFHGGQPFGDGGVGGGAAAEPDDVGGGGAGQVAAEGVPDASGAAGDQVDAAGPPGGRGDLSGPVR